MESSPAIRQPAEVRVTSAGMANPAQEFASILVRRKGTILFVFLLVTGIVAAGAVTAPPNFKAESSLLVRIGREYIYRPEVGRTESSRIPSLSEMVNSEVEILSSRDLAEQVVEELGVETLYPELLELEPEPLVAAERAVLRFRGSVHVRGVLESSVIKVSFEHTDPQIAADSVNLLVERFKDKHVEVFGEVHSTFLDDQLSRRSEELAKAEDALASFKQNEGVFDLGAQRNLLLGQRDRLEDTLRQCSISIQELENRLKNLDGEGEKPASLPAPGLRGALLTKLQDLDRELRTLDLAPPSRTVEEASYRLLQLELEENALRQNYVGTNRRVESVRADREKVQAYLEGLQQRTSELDQTRRGELVEGIQQLESEIAAMDQAELVADLEALRIQEREHLQKADLLEQQIHHLDRQARTLRQLERSLATAEVNEQTYRERTEEARIAQELDREKRINVRVIEKAARPLAPTGLSRNMKIALGAFVGLLCGAAVAVFLELFRSR